MPLSGIWGWGQIRPGSCWQESPGAPWLGWHLSVYDFPADEVSESVDTWMEEQVLTSDPQPSGTFPFLPPSIENNLQ